MRLTSPAASARQKVHIEYDLVGYIPVDELLKAEQARPKSCLFQEI